MPNDPTIRLPSFPDSKTLFYSEDSRCALLVTKAARRRQIAYKMLKTAEAALAWSRSNGVVMVYLPPGHRQN